MYTLIMTPPYCILILVMYLDNKSNSSWNKEFDQESMLPSKYIAQKPSNKNKQFLHGNCSLATEMQVYKCLYTIYTYIIYTIYVITVSLRHVCIL